MCTENENNLINRECIFVSLSSKVTEKYMIYIHARKVSASHDFS